MRPPWLSSSSHHGGLPSLVMLLGFMCGRPVIAAERVDNPSPENYLRRAYSAVTIINNWIYIDGGELSQIVDGKRPSSFPVSKPMNATLAIDLSTSWLASDVTIHEIKRPDNINLAAPPMNVGGVWNDPSGDSFYLWGGIAPYNQGANRISREGIWKFTPRPDNPTAGTWTFERPENPSVLSSIRTSFHGGFVTAGNTGFWLGGYAQANKTEPEDSGLPGAEVSGLISFNMETKEWRNDSAIDLIPQGNARGPGGLWLPKFGPNGLVSFIGGRTVTNVGNGVQEFSNVTFFDPVTRKSYYQATTGDAPSPRKDFCSVVAESPRGGHEVFIFGGANPKEGQSETYSDMYVLTLPGFQWFKVNDTYGGPRSSHSCVIAGQRQMISIGGTSSNNFNGVNSKWEEPDTFEQGIGIFDMVTLRWSTNGQYDAYAKDYESPEVVNQWYQTAGDLSQRQWTSPEVQALFATGNGGADNTTNGGSNNDSSSSDSGSSSSTGAIVGGVVGGVGALLIVGGAWMFIRRKNQRAAAANAVNASSAENQPFGAAASPGSQYYQPSPQSGMQELSPGGGGNNLSPDASAKYYTPMHSQELPATFATTELPSQNEAARWELDSTSVPASQFTGTGTAR